MKRILFVLLLAFVPALASAQSPDPYSAAPTQALMPPIIVFPGSANQVLAVDGSATFDAWAFASQPNLGVYRPSANILRISSGGSFVADFGTSIGTGVSMLLYNGALAIGGTVNTSSFMLKNNAGAMQLRLADDSAYAALFAAGITSSTTVSALSYVATGTVPTLSGCGTGATVAGGLTNFAITVGTTPGTCVATLQTNYSNPPICSVQNSAGTALGAATTSGASPTVTFAGTIASTNKLHVNCVGY
jgi:hypothetical protein